MICSRRLSRGVGDMEDLAVDVVAAAERGEGSGGVNGVGVAVGSIRVPMTRAALPASAAPMTRSPSGDWAVPRRAEVPSDARRDRHPEITGFVQRPELFCHVSRTLPLRVCARIGVVSVADRFAVGVAVVGVLERDEACTCDAGGAHSGILEPRELLHPPMMVWRVPTLVDDCCISRSGAGECRVGQVSARTSTCSGTSAGPTDSRAARNDPMRRVSRLVPARWLRCPARHVCDSSTSPCSWRPLRVSIGSLSLSDLLDSVK